jgi:hypothetical protein
VLQLHGEGRVGVASVPVTIAKVTESKPRRSIVAPVCTVLSAKAAATGTRAGMRWMLFS